jgi:hypothetical protein
LLKEPDAAFAVIGGGDIQVFVNGPFGQVNTVWVAPRDESAQES